MFANAIDKTFTFALLVECSGNWEMAEVGIRLGPGMAVCLSSGQQDEQLPQWALLDIKCLESGQHHINKPDHYRKLCVCDGCITKLLSSDAFDNLLEAGLVFTARPEYIQASADRGCPMCKLFYFTLVLGKAGHNRSFLKEKVLRLRVWGSFVQDVSERQLRIKVEMHEGMVDSFTAMSQQGLFPIPLLISSRFRSILLNSR